MVREKEYRSAMADGLVDDKSSEAAWHGRSKFIYDRSRSIVEGNIQE